MADDRGGVDGWGGRPESPDRGRQLVLISLAALAGLSALWWLLATLAGPRAISAAYHRESLAFLNRVIEDPSTHSLDFYLDLWRALTGQVLRGLLVLGLLLVPVAVAVTRNTGGRDLASASGHERPDPGGQASPRAAALLALGIAGALVWLILLHPVAYVSLLGEDRWVEFATMAALFSGGLLLVWAFAFGTSRGRPFLLLLALAALFVGMEEISWGQRLFGFRTPEAFREQNVQGEMSFHNLLPFSAWPYAVLGAAVLGWLFVWPRMARPVSSLGRRARAWGPPSSPRWIAPLFVLAAFALLGSVLSPIYLDEWAELFGAFAVAALGMDLCLSAGPRSSRDSLLLLASLALPLAVTGALLSRAESPYSSVTFNRMAGSLFPAWGLDRQAAKLFRHVESQPRLLEDDTYIRHGELLLRLGEDARAERALQFGIRMQDSLIENRAGDPAPYRHRMLAYRLLGQTEAAQRDFGRAMRLDSAGLAADPGSEDTWRFHFSMAKTLTDWGDIDSGADQAREACSRAHSRRERNLVRMWRLRYMPDTPSPPGC